MTLFLSPGVVDLNSGTVASAAFDNTMSFDGCGNRTQLNGAIQAYNNMNQPTGGGITHDNNGNLATWNSWSYTYDAQNRLKEAANLIQGVTVDFYYDGLNRQIARVVTDGSSGGSPTPTPSPIVVPSVSPLPTVPPIYTPTVPPVTTPTPSVPAGVIQQCAPVTFSSIIGFKVQMNTATAGATIFYTTDGTTPTHNGSTPTGTTRVYTAPVYVGNCNEIFFEAIAYKLGMSDSDITMYDAKFWNGACGQGTGGGSGSGVITFSVWDGDWAILEEYNSTGTRIQGYVQGYHGLVKTLVDNLYYYQDELGSTSHLANSSGNVIEYYKYDLYGRPTYWDGSGSQITATAYNVRDLGNGGARWMPELGLYDDRNRFMSPDMGRFLQPDPIGFKGDASNLYRYVGNDWANKTDPTGLGEEAQRPLPVEVTSRRAGAVEDAANASHTLQEKISASEVKYQANVDSQHPANVGNARAETKLAARANAKENPLKQPVKDVFNLRSGEINDQYRAYVIAHRAELQSDYDLANGIYQGAGIYSVAAMAGMAVVDAATVSAGAAPKGGSGVIKRIGMEVLKWAFRMAAGEEGPPPTRPLPPRPPPRIEAPGKAGIGAAPMFNPGPTTDDQ